MIATTTIRLTSPSGSFNPLVLAPYGEAELSHILPIDPELIPHTPYSTKREFRGPAARLLGMAHSQDHVQEWGIYDGVIDTEQFVGTINVAECSTDTGEHPQHINRIRELGTLVVNQGKGLGTRAKLALASYIFEHTDTLLLQSCTSEYNSAAQRSLTKIGFTFDRLSYRIPLGYATQTQHWQLARPEAHGTITSPEATARLMHGYAQYNTLRQAVVVTVDA